MTPPPPVPAAINELCRRVDAIFEGIAELYAHPSVQERFSAHWLRKAKAGIAVSSSKATDDDDVPDEVERVVSGTKALGLDTHTLFYHVEPTYYSWPLEKRVLRLSAPSVRHLCKTLIFENTRHAMNPGSDDPFERTNSKYYAVVVQYAGKMNTQRLINFVYEANAKRAPKKAFNFRMAPEEVSHRLSGYATGGVTPFGLAEPRLPVVVARQIADLVPPVLFLGAGHVDWKMAVPVARFVDAARCFVVDLE